MQVSIVMLFVHWLADFKFQSNYMALGKSKAWKPLLLHTSVYSACFLPWGIKFALVTFLLHTLVDYYTSRITSKLWFIELGQQYATNLFDWAKVDARKRHWFFTTIGFDQWLHALCLAITSKYLLG